MQHAFDWHVAWEQGQPIWLRILDTPLPDGDVVSLAVWSIPRSTAWEWEILAISDDQHVQGGSASSQDEAMAAAEAASTILADRTSKAVGPRAQVQPGYCLDADVPASASPMLSRLECASPPVAPSVSERPAAEAANIPVRDSPP